MRFRLIAPSVWFASRSGINVSLLLAGEDAVLVDAGKPTMSGPILSALSSVPDLRGRRLAHIVLTHVHYDHAGGAAEIARRTGARIWTHPADGALAQEGRWRRTSRPSPTWHGHALTRLVANRYPHRIPPIESYRPVGEDRPVAGVLKALHVPGHSAGQVALRWIGPDESETVFAGDTIMNMLGPREPILYENRAEGLRSIAALATFAEGADRILVGHGGPMKVTTLLLRRMRKLSGE